MSGLSGLRWMLGGAALLGPAACAGGAGQAGAAQSGALPARSTTSTSPTPWPTATAASRASPPCASAWPTRGRSLFVLAGDVLSPSLLSKYYSRPPDGRGVQRRQARLRHLRQPRVRAAARHARGPDRRVQLQVALEQLRQGRRDPVRQGPALGHGPGVGAEGRPLRPDPPGRLPEGLPLHRPGQRGAPRDRHARRAGRRAGGRDDPPDDRGRPRPARRASPGWTSSWAGTSTRRTTRSSPAGTSLKADANSRTAQFVTLWGGKGAVAAGGRAGEDGQPSARRHAVARGRGRGGTTACARGSGPNGWSAGRRCRSTRATRSAGSRSRCSATW